MIPIQDPLKLVEYERKTLELRKYATIVGIGKTTADSLIMEESEDFLSRQILRRIEMDVLTDKIAEDTYKSEYSYWLYTSPWQWFKQLYMPLWFVNKFPAKQQQITKPIEVKFTRYATYPKANIAIQKDKHFFEIMLGGGEVLRDEVTRIR